METSEFDMEVIIKMGYSLNAQIEAISGLNRISVYRVTDSDKKQTFRICLDDILDPITLEALNLGKDDLFICRDSALNDEMAANLALQCRLKTIDDHESYEYRSRCMNTNLLRLEIKLRDVKYDIAAFDVHGHHIATWDLTQGY